MLLDLHVHTRFGSNCSYMYPWQMAQRARELGLEAVCITEHNLTWEAEALSELSQRYGILVFGGMEVTTDLGEVLVFGLQQPVTDVTGARELRRMVDEADGVMIAAHPFRQDVWGNGNPDLERACAKPLLQLVEAVEVFNGMATRQEVAFGCQVVERLGLRAVGGSDSHAPHSLGQCLTIFERPLASDRELIAELKAGRFKAAHRILDLVY